MKKIKLVALIAALSTAFGIYFLFNTMNKPVPTAKANVIVAAVGIAANTVVTKDMITETSLPAEAVLPNAVRDPSMVIGSVLKVDAVAGEQILSDRLAKTGKANGETLAYSIQPGMRAITISVDSTKGVGNMLRPENTVDIIVHFQQEIPEKKTDGTTVLKMISLSKILIQNIKVLAVDQMLSKDAKVNSSGYSTITLEVTPKQAVELSFSAKNASLQAILRSPVDSKTVDVPAVTEKDVAGSQAGG